MNATDFQSACLGEAGLSPGLENGHGDGIGQVEAALAGQHRQAQTFCCREVVQDFARQAACFAAEDEDVVVVQALVEGAGLSRSGHRPAAALAQCQLTGVPVGMPENTGIFMVVETGAAQGLVVDVETQWFDKMQFGPGIGAQADDIAGVGWNFGLVEDDGDHSGVSGTGYAEDVIRPMGQEIDSMTQGTCHDGNRDLRGAMHFQYAGTFAKCRSAGHDVVY